VQMMNLGQELIPLGDRLWSSFCFHWLYSR